MEKTRTARGRRPSWMTIYGEEGQGDVFSQFLWNEYPVPSFTYDATTDSVSAGKVETGRYQSPDARRHNGGTGEQRRLFRCAEQQSIRRRPRRP